jgi:hypothetical protein
MNDENTYAKRRQTRIRFISQFSSGVFTGFGLGVGLMPCLMRSEFFQPFVYLTGLAGLLLVTLGGFIYRVNRRQVEQECTPETTLRGRGG